MMVSTSLVRSDKVYSNRCISLALKRLEEALMTKMKIFSKRELYRMFGKYFFQQANSMPNGGMIET